MKHDDGSHGCMREEDKKRQIENEAPMSKPKGSSPNAQKSFKNHSPILQHNNSIMIMDSK